MHVWHWQYSWPPCWLKTRPGYAVCKSSACPSARPGSCAAAVSDTLGAATLHCLAGSELRCTDAGLYPKDLTRCAAATYLDTTTTLRGMMSANLSAWGWPRSSKSRAAVPRAQSSALAYRDTRARPCRLASAHEPQCAALSAQRPRETKSGVYKIPCWFRSV